MSLFWWPDLFRLFVGLCVCGRVDQHLQGGGYYRACLLVGY